MKFVLNKGKPKIIKYSSGIMKDIPEGSSSMPDDPKLDKVINSNPDLSYISRDQFNKLNKIIPTEEKVAAAKKEKAPPQPPKKQSKKKKSYVTNVDSTDDQKEDHNGVEGNKEEPKD